MELAQFPIALRSRCGQMVELSLRACLLCLAFLPLEKYRLLRREYLEKLFRVASRRESGVDLLLLWHADSAISLAKPMSQAGAIWLPAAVKLPPVS